MQDDEHVLCGACAARLAGQLQIGWLALVLTGTGLLLIAQGSPWLWPSAAVAVGVVERYAIARLAIDARLFEQLQMPGHDLARLDQALAALGMSAPGKAGRALLPRIAGTRRWMLCHTLLVGAQTLCIAIALRSPG